MFFGGGGIPLGIDPDDEFYGIDWSKIDKPVKLTVTERVDIDNLQAFAGSEEGKKEISTFYPEDEDNDNNEDQLDNVFDGKSAREIILMFLQNIEYQETYEVSLARSRVGHMLCQFKCIKESRLYATKVTGEEKYPWSVTQLPRPIRAVALGRNFQQNDDSSAFQRILLGFTQDDETKEVLKAKVLRTSP